MPRRLPHCSILPTGLNDCHMMFAIRRLFRLSVRAMPPRDVHQHHRASTPLELLFDLVTVIAVAAAAGELHHGAAHGHALQAAGHFVLAFFAIWWAWMNYSWFASAYDNDDTLFRLLTLLVMAGSLVVAAGIPSFFQRSDLTLVVWGFVLMRLGMVLFWLRASLHDTARQATTRSYATGLVLVQLYWCGLWYWQPAQFGTLALLFVCGALAELAVPVLAERQGVTSWHRQHMIERYGLLTLIVLGETLLAISNAVRSLLLDGAPLGALLLGGVSVLALLLVFSLWWLYFSREEHLTEHSYRMAFAWGYGHLLIYASGAAVGAAVAVLVDALITAPDAAASHGWLLSLAVAGYLTGLWLVRDRYIFQGAGRYVLLIMALLLLLLTGIMQGYITPLLSPALGLTTGVALCSVLTLVAALLRSSHACCKSRAQ